jgi:glycosyltransferase involved in cell wall biosynthesis
MIRVAYIVGEISDMTVPAEVANSIRSIEDINIQLFSYYNYDTSSVYEGKPKTFGANYRIDPKSIKRGIRKINNFCPDVVHVNHTISSLIMSLVGIANDYKVLKTEHNNHEYYRVHQKISTKFVFAMSDKIICNSFNTKNSFSKLEKIISNKKTGVVYNGVNITRIDKSGKWEKITGRNKICSVGRLVEQKNYVNLLRATSMCKEELKEIVIVGDGRKANELKSKSEKEGVGDILKLTGEVGRMEVYRELYRSDIFVMPSLWEGFCNAVVEAMVAGRVIVCSDIPTLREVVGPCGMYFDPKSVSSIATTLDRALRLSRSERAERGRASRERAVEKFDMRESARKYAKHYRELASRSN